MGHHHERDTHLRLQLAKLGAHRLAQFCIQRRQWLIQQQHARAFHQCPRQRHPLPLPAGQLIGPATAEPIQFDQRQRFFHAHRALAAGHAVHLQAVTHIVSHAHVREHGVILEHHVDWALVGRNIRHVLPVDQDAAFRWHFEPGQHAQQGGLAAARGPQQREELALPHLQIDSVHRHHLAVPLGNAFEAYDGATLGHAACLAISAPCNHKASAVRPAVSRMSRVEAALTAGVTEKRTIE